VTISSCERARGRRVETSGPGVRRGAAGRILIVDDDPKYRAFVARGLTESGMVGSTAPDGESALERLSGERFDLVLLDVMLPGLQGWDVMEALRDRNIDVPVIWVTARDAVDERVKGLRMGGDDYIVKPFAFAELLAGSGQVIAQSGDGRLLALVPDAIPLGDSWRSRLLSDSVAIESKRHGRYQLEIVADATEEVDRIIEFSETAVGFFLAAALLTGLTGWFTTHRGRRSLREVAAQAGGFGSAADVGPIVLDGAPDEVRVVGHALDDMLMRLQEKLNDMRAFAAGLAHELRSPLQNLIGETEVTLMSLRSPEEYRTVLRSNLEDLDELTDAVDNLVTFCRTSEPTRSDLQVETFDLAREAELRLERERRIAERKGIRVELVSEGDARLEADRESVLRVLRNLVANAIVWSSADSHVHVNIQGRENDVRLVVEDEGPGVTADLGDRIYEPFVTGRTKQGKRGLRAGAGDLPPDRDGSRGRAVPRTGDERRSALRRVHPAPSQAAGHLRPSAHPIPSRSAHRREPAARHALRDRRPRCRPGRSPCGQRIGKSRPGRMGRPSRRAMAAI